MKWNVYDKDDKYLGTVHAANEQAALCQAQAEGMPRAFRVTRRDE